MENLAKQKCVPCEGGIPPFDEKMARKFLQEVKGWELVEGTKKIRKKFVFKNFLESMDFVNKMAAIAQIEGHHPDIFISYNRVEITNYTHKINGLHNNDFVLAAKIDLLYKNNGRFFMAYSRKENIYNTRLA